MVQNYRNVASTPNNSNNVGVRLNAPLTNKDRFTFNIQYQNRDSQRSSSSDIAIRPPATD